MKKVILLVGCFSLLALGAISVSCKKDKDWKGCSCTFLFLPLGEFPAEDLKAEGINNCSELQASLTDENEGATGITCKDL